MSYFEDRFRKHAIHSSIENCLDSIQTHELENLNENEVIAISRTEHVIKFAEIVLNRCDPDLINPAALDQLNNSCTKILSHWNQYVQGRDWNILTSPCDNFLSIIATLSSKQRPIPKSYSNLLSSLRDRTAKMLQQFREYSQEQGEEIENFSSRLDDFSQSLDNYESQINAQKTRIDSLITKQQETFALAQENRTEKFTEFISNKDSDFEESQTEYGSKFNSLYQQEARSGQKQIEELKKHCEHAKDIIGIIGNIGVTGNYQNIANQEKRIADLFRWIAVGCFGAMLIAVIVVLVASFKAERFGWDMALFRVLTAAIFAAPGIYCAMESSKHRRKEQENRKIELELASISPFLEKLNDSEASKEILKKLAPEYFGDHTISEDGSPFVNIDSKSVEAAMKPILELVKLLK